MIDWSKYTIKELEKARKRKRYDSLAYQNITQAIYRKRLKARKGKRAKRKSNYDFYISNSELRRIRNSSNPKTKAKIDAELRRRGA